MGLVAISMLMGAITQPTIQIIHYLPLLDCKVRALTPKHSPGLDAGCHGDDEALQGWRFGGDRPCLCPGLSPY